MGRTCEWCGSLMRAVTGSATPSSHALCSGCLEELRSALAENGLEFAQGRESDR
ncbi:MAG: hypothetical protein JRG86_07785 [Deltaproteobacteria bacterium]|jgi:hypothetical protein|nr:hypothetical protein [Deltaproteobacteria bacterium]MBW2496727.1 hypothetical protein [Deltaproteobacteria bacterium]